MEICVTILYKWMVAILNGNSAAPVPATRRCLFGVWDCTATLERRQTDGPEGQRTEMSRRRSGMLEYRRNQNLRKISTINRRSSIFRGPKSQSRRS